MLLVQSLLTELNGRILFCTLLSFCSSDQWKIDFHSLLSSFLVSIYNLINHCDSPRYDIFQMNVVAQNIAKDMMEDEGQSPTLLTQMWNGDQILSNQRLVVDHLSKARTYVHNGANPVNTAFLELLISNFHLARVLLLDNAEFEKLPEKIENLWLLRYLSLVGNLRIEVLPDSICSLVNLQTLDLSAVSTS